MANPRKYVLIPVMPTPNGPLHLGHVAGPFLKMDVLARHLRRNGEAVAVVSATDPYETHVLPKADAQGKPVEQICAENHQAIHACLHALNIHYDAFINPLEPLYRSRLGEITREVIDDLTRQGLLHTGIEPVHISRQTGRVIVGSRLAGICPHCGEAMGGYHCEGCGMEVSPRDIRLPRAEPEDASVEVTQRTSVFLNADLSILTQRMLQARVPADIRRIAEQFMRTSNGTVRMSNPGEWGEPWPDARASAPAVVFTYTALFMLSVLCGDVARDILDLDSHPFDASSETRNITSFGFDNTVPFCVSVAALAEHSSRYRGFDRYLTNFFYTLDGQKFSTSRQHCIWAHQALPELETSSDVLRYFLAKTSPETSPTDFSRQEFRAFQHAIKPRLARMQAELRPGADDNLPDRAADTLKRLVADMNTALDVDHFSLRAAARCLDAWLGLEWPHGSPSAYTRGFCVLAYPIMPQLALALWRGLGHDGLPRTLVKTAAEEIA